MPRPWFVQQTAWNCYWEAYERLLRPPLYGGVCPSGVDENGQRLSSPTNSGQRTGPEGCYQAQQKRANDGEQVVRSTS